MPTEVPSVISCSGENGQSSIESVSDSYHESDRARILQRSNSLTADKAPHGKSGITEDNDQSELCFGDDCFPHEAIQKFSFEERLEGNQIVKSSSAVVFPPQEARWDYHADTSFRGPKGLTHGGVCVNAKREDGGFVEFSFEGHAWEFDRTFIRGIETFGMSDLENAYWIPLLTGLVKGVEVPGLTLNQDLRPFLYAIPLKGIVSKGNAKSFKARDFGVTSGEDDDLFAPLIANTKLGQSEAVWEADVPKAWGLVLARSFNEAEALALERARFTADLVNFALSAGVSHFETSYGAEPLDWNISVGRSVVSLEPWILLREANPVKGWIRSVPLVEQVGETDLEDGHERIDLFAHHFLKASQAGDIEEQTGRRTLSTRERKLSSGIQRTLRWHGVASREESLSDQFIATWISLESILNAIDYPNVFGGERDSIRDAIKEAIGSLHLPGQTDDPLVISQQMIESRTLQNQWPPRTKLRLFAKAFGIELKPGDSELLRDLAPLRNEVFHAGVDELRVSDEQLRRLRYLVERLVIAASIDGYHDLEERSEHQLQFGTIGPMGGAAPLSLDGRDVSYSLRMVQDENGLQFEVAIEGKLYDEQNAVISFAKE